MRLKRSVFWLSLLVLGGTEISLSGQVHNYFGKLTPQERQLLKDNERVHLSKAMAHLRSGKKHRLEYAEAEFKYILAIWPNHPASLQGMTDVAIRLGRPEVADFYFRKALEFFPEVPETYALYGIYLYKINDLDRSIEMLEKAVQLAPHSSQNHYLLGLSYYAAKQYDLALQHAQQAYNMGYPLPGLRDLLSKKGYRLETSDKEGDEINPSVDDKNITN